MSARRSAASGDARWVELAVLGFAASLAGAGAMALLGAILGGLRSGQGRAERPPERGAVPAARHHQADAAPR